MDAWRVIGHFGSAVGDVPRVLPAAVLDPSGTFVVNSDVADNEAGLRTLASMAVSEFLSCVETGGASMLEPVMWEPGAVLLTVEGYVERLSVWEAELILNRFVREQRAVGRLLLSVATGKPLSTLSTARAACRMIPRTSRWLPPSAPSRRCNASLEQLCSWVCESLCKASTALSAHEFRAQGRIGGEFGQRLLHG